MDEDSQGLEAQVQGTNVAQGASQQASPEKPAPPAAQGAVTEDETSGIERKLSAEAAAYRRKVRELEAKLKQYEEAQLSEQEKLQRRLAELERQQAEWERQRQETVLRYETMLAAQRMGIVDPDAAWRLIDMNAIEFDEDGNPSNLDAVLRALVQERKWLAGGAQISASNPATNTPAARIFTRSQLRDPKFFREHRDEIMQAVRDGRVQED